MFGSLTVYDGMTQVLSRIFRVPVNDKPITIVELTGLPTEIINVVVSVLSRMTFDFAHWSEGKVPLTLVCEEAHRYVPATPRLGFEPCKRAIAKIAKEGRKYGVALCIVSQRPAEIDPTILSQCNTVFALRMSNDRDQEIVTSAITDTGSGLLEFLPALGQREALAFGDGVALPVRIIFDELPAEACCRARPPRTSPSIGSARSETRASSSRSSRSGAPPTSAPAAMMQQAADARRRHGRSRPRRRAAHSSRRAPRRRSRRPAAPCASQAACARLATAQPSIRQARLPQGRPQRRRPGGAPQRARRGGRGRRRTLPGTALKSLRDRLIQRQQR